MANRVPPASRCTAIGQRVDLRERSRGLASSREASRMFGTPSMACEHSQVAEWSDPPQAAARTQPEAASPSSEESFRLIVETIPGLIAVMTASGGVEHVNRQVLEYFGRTLEELRNWGTTDAVHPADLPRVTAAWQQAVQTGEPY